MDIRETIIETMNNIAAAELVNLNFSAGDDTVLLECGLDSLSFAMLVVDLENVFGVDPFQVVDDAYYPKTLGEFVMFYEKYID